jgi:hypothetical protein
MTTTTVFNWGGEVILNNFNTTSVLGLKWLGGNAFVFGKVRICVSDKDPQNFYIWLTHGYPNPQTIDYVALYTSGIQVVTLAGWAYDLPEGEVIEIYCATYTGFADDTRLNVLLVEDMRGSSPPPLSPPPAKASARPIHGGKRRSQSRPRPGRIGPKVTKRKK